MKVKVLLVILAAILMWVIYAISVKDPVTVALPKVGNPVLYLPVVARAINFDRIICSSKDIDVEVYRPVYKFESLSWNLRYDLGNAWYPVLAGSCANKAVGYGITLPVGMPAGIYQYRPEAKYVVNALNIVRKPLPIVEFVVY